MCDKNNVRQTSDEDTLTSCETREVSKEWLLDKLWVSSEKLHNFFYDIEGPSKDMIVEYSLGRPDNAKEKGVWQVELELKSAMFSGHEGA